MRVGGQIHGPTDIFPGKRSRGTHSTGGSMGPTAATDTSDKINNFAYGESNHDSSDVQSVA